MITFLVFLAWLSIISGSLIIVTMGLSDVVMKTGYLEAVQRRIDLSDPQVIIILVLLIVVYLIIFVLYFVHKLTKYSENKVIKSKSGEITVTYKTINNLVKEYLGAQKFIKSIKTKTAQKGRGVVIHAVLELYSIKDLNSRLQELQNELVEYLFNSTGVELKKSYFKIKKLIQNQEIYTFYAENTDTKILDYKEKPEFESTLKISGMKEEEEKENKEINLQETK
ncbi:alkaline shock response membrane anchor protein AmaP [Sebaldella sp. S0638]|uniref:alkaline shock response membrane anchor protein AmaP n=1 Tax=Sebaldella sp. S0638 TaxID=2957809 RepID=UPI00209FF47F|nr:alkaline shock response membrane anchor protein AmaP [Sebaldella sp. S0638]MCP1224554.1 alkaline shock response membrane anchor protein AmaP [Sebaldella sp. S0638]